MNFNRALFFLCMLSLLSTAAVLLIGMAIKPDEHGAGYAVLGFDEALQDRELRELLTVESGFLPQQIISESSQWVMLDEFGTLTKVPLDEYQKRVMVIDPRNDGYAQRLKDFFIFNGKRYVFITAEAGNFSGGALEKKISGVLGVIPYSIDYFTFGRSSLFFLLLFGISLLIIIVIAVLMKKPHSFTKGILPCLPVLVSLSIFGRSALVLSAVIVGLSALMWEPLVQLFPVLVARRKSNIQKYIYEPYKYYFYLIPFFFLVITFIIFYARIVPWFAIIVIFLYFALYFCSLWVNSLQAKKRFSPLTIIKRRIPDFVFTVYMLPFAITAFLPVIFEPMRHGSNTGALYGNYSFDSRIIDEREYYAHIAFQTSFSGNSLDRNGAVYASYVQDSDGLISPVQKAASDELFMPMDIPPFPLKDLMVFMDTYGNRNIYTYKKGSSIAALIGSLLVVLTILIFINIQWGDKKQKKYYHLLIKDISG
ncbi:MAG: hypothetical protein FWG99_01455 [Treponema sp.]|nr:hypothetical protein [Treponema sp.]